MKEDTKHPDVHLFPHERGDADTDDGAVHDRFLSMLTSDDEEDAPGSSGEPELDEDEESEEGDDPSESEEDEDDGESEEEDEESEDSEEEPEVEVTLPGGEKAKVTLSELTRGYSRTQDYTRKTQALAEERKAFEAERQRTAQARQQYAEALTQVEDLLKASMPAEPDWETLRRQNPAEFAAQWAEWQQRQQDLQAVALERQRAQQEQMAEWQRHLEGVYREESKRLVEAIPEWQDEKVMKQEKAELFEFAKALGYSEEELAAVFDHRVLLVLRDAKRYRDLQTKGKKQIQEKTKKVKVLQPGSPKHPSTQKKGRSDAVKRARNRLARSGSVHDAARTILSMGLLDD